MRVLLGLRGEATGPSRDRGPAEDKESQTGRHCYHSGPGPRRAPGGGSGNTSAMLGERGDHVLLARQLLGRARRAYGVEKVLQCGV
jgi:hypothetical protein